MRWTKLSIRDFGPLDRWEGSIDENMVVFLGNNEAGKSTMMEVLSALLFGFRRKKSEMKNLIHWGSNQARLEGKLVRQDGKKALLQRTLRSREVKGVYEQEGVSRNLDDQPLPWLAPLDRELYRNIYALSLFDLLFPRQEAWEMIQDQLLGGTMNRQLRPVSQVKEELYRQTMALWRPDRRGKTRMEELSAALRQVTDQLSQARQAQEELAQLEESRSRQLEQIGQLRQRQQALQQRMEALLTQRDWAQRFRQGRELLAQAGDVDAYGALTDDVEARLEAMRGRQRDIARQVSEIGRSLAQCNEEMERFTFREERLLERRAQIEELYGQRDLLEESSDRLPQVKEQAQQAAARAEQYLREQLTENGGNGPALSDPQALEIEAGEALDAHMALLRAKEKLSDAMERSRSSLPTLMAVGGCAFLTGAAVVLPPLRQVALPPAMGWPLSVSLAVLGLGAIFFSVPLAKGMRRRKTRDFREKYQAAQERDEEAGRQLRAALSGFRVRRELEMDPGELALRAQRYARLVREERELKENLRRMKDGTLQNGSQVQALARELLPEECGEAPLENLHLLWDALQQALAWQQRREELYEQMKALRAQLAELKSAQQQAVDSEKQITDLLYPIPGETVADKMAVVQQRRAAARKGAALMEAAEGRPVPDEAAVQSEMDGISLQMKEAASALENLYNAQGASEQRSRHLQNQPDPDQLAQQREELLQRQQALTRERDEKALLFALLQLSEQRFRERHQPDVVRRASSYLSQITYGRYNRIVLSDDSQSVRLFSPEAGEFVDPVAARLSQGTLEQVFLSLRLGLVDHLDPQGEKLPLLLDETFVNWDHDRLVRGLAVLGQVAGERQLMLFTCHDWMVDALKESGCRFQLIHLEDGHV